MVDVAGIRNQDLARGTLQEAERRGEGEDVIERKHGERGFLADHKGLGNPRAGLLDVREHIPMRQHGALCDAGRAAGVLKKRDIRVLKRHGAETGGVSLGERVAETDEMRHAEGRDHFFHVLHSEIHERPLEERKEVGNTGGNHRFNGGAGNGFFERFAESFGDDHHLRAAVSELIMQFAGGVEGVHVDRDAARLQNAEKGHRILKNVRHHDGDAVAGFQCAERLEIAREVRGDVIHLAIGERLLHADESRVVGVVLCHPFKKARDAGAEVRIDLCRNTLRIMRNPRKFWHF